MKDKHQELIRAKLESRMRIFGCQPLLPLFILGGLLLGRIRSNSSSSQHVTASHRQKLFNSLDLHFPIDPALWVCILIPAPAGSPGDLHPSWRGTETITYGCPLQWGVGHGRNRSPPCCWRRVLGTGTFTADSFCAILGLFLINLIFLLCHFSLDLTSPPTSTPPILCPLPSKSPTKDVPEPTLLYSLSSHPLLNPKIMQLSGPRHGSSRR